MDDRLSGAGASWSEYFPNAVKSVLSCRGRNAVNAVRDVLRAIRRFRPDLTPYQLTLRSCWTVTKDVFHREAALIVSLRLWLTKRGWLPAGHSVAIRSVAADDRDGGGGDGEVRCEVLYDPGPGSTFMDVVFIHGLRGDKLKTWKQGVFPKRAGREPEPVVVRGAGPSTAVGRLQRLTVAEEEEINEFTDCWPRDWLPLDCPYVRVITISYSTDPYLWRPIWLSTPARTTMRDRGLEMISLLRDFRVGHNPITWVGHSKGGLFIKQILVHANESRHTHQIITNTKGILFYSVPHNGSPLANIKLPLFQRSIELQELVNDTQDIRKLQKTFREMMNNINGQVQVKSFIETKLTLMKLIYLRIVSVQSADPGFGDLYGVPVDHRNICKPKNRNCFLYQELVNMIHSLKRATSEETA